MKQWQHDIFNLYVEQRGRKGRNVSKYHPAFKKTRQDVRLAGLSVPSRDAPNFIATLLYNLDILNDDEADSIIRARTSPARGESLMKALEDHSDEIRERQEEISNVYEEELSKYINRAKINRGRGGKGSKGRTEKYEAQAAAIEIAKQQNELLKQIKSKGIDAASSIEDAILNSMESSKDETLISMQIKNLSDSDGLINTIERLGVDKNNIGVERVSQGVIVDFFIPKNSKVGRDFESIPPEEIDDMFGQFSSTGEVVVEVLPPDEVEDAISSLKSNLSRPDTKSAKNIYDEPEKAEPEDEVEFDPTTSGEVETIAQMDDEKEDYRPTEDDFDEVGVAYDPFYDRNDDLDIDTEEDSYDPMNPYGEDRYEDEESNKVPCEECDGTGHKDYRYDRYGEPEMEFDNCRTCEGTGKVYPGLNKTHPFGSDEDNEDFSSETIQIHGKDYTVDIEKRQDAEYDWQKYTAIIRNKNGSPIAIGSGSNSSVAIAKAIVDGEDYGKFGKPPRLSGDHFGEEDIQGLYSPDQYEGNESEGKYDDGDNKKERCDYIPCENNEDIKMSPQQIDQWMASQRLSRMQNRMKHDERWK